MALILVSIIEVDYQDDEERPKIRLIWLDNDGCDYNKDADGDDSKSRLHHYL